MSVDLVTLESELQSLYRQRDQVEYRLRGLESKERNQAKKRGERVSTRDSSSKRARDDRPLIDRNETEPNKKPKLSSAVVTNDREMKDAVEREKEKEKPKVTSSIVTSNPIPVIGEKPRPALKSEHPDKVRNKKLFGALLVGTLQSFKKQLSHKTQATIRREELEQKVESKVMHEQEQEVETQKRVLQEEKSKELTLKEEIRKNLQEKEKELLRLKWESNRNQLSKFIRTETKPHLYFREVIPNDNTKKDVENSKETEKEKEESKDSKESKDNKEEKTKTTTTNGMEDQQN